MRKKLYLVLDTETATLPFANSIATTAQQKKKIAIAKPLVYDIGWCIMERNGNIIRRENFLVQETFFVPNVFNTAYYRDKRPIYMELYGKGSLPVASWDAIMQKLLLDLRATDIACAYNAAFDFKKAIPFTEQYITALYSSDYTDWERKQWGHCKAIINGKTPANNPEFLSPVFTLRDEDFPIADLWDIACERLINIDKYRDYCLSHSLLTASAQFFKTSAETSFQYLGKQYDFVEAHTALDDAEIESFILAKALKKGKVEPQMGAFPFRKLGTTVDYVSEHRPQYTETVIKLMEEYYNNLPDPYSRYAEKVAHMINRLERAGD